MRYYYDFDQIFFFMAVIGHVFHEIFNVQILTISVWLWATY